MELVLLGGSLWNSSVGSKDSKSFSTSFLMASEVEINSLLVAKKRVKNLHNEFEPTSWSKKHPEELNLSFPAYINSNPNRPNSKRTTLYIQPIGEFSKTHTKVMKATADILSRQFGVPVKTLPTLTISVIPKTARRVHPSWGMDQIQSTYVLNNVLMPNRPDDAVAVLAMTTYDLWPGEKWNFVFGQASLRERVGVWSLYRYGNPDESEEAYQTFLLRTLKVATHETGHMMGIPHCSAYQCAMNGSNNLGETDSRPLAFCPECSTKLWWSTKQSPEKWYLRMSEFSKTQSLEKEAAFWKSCYEAVSN